MELRRIGDAVYYSEPDHTLDQPCLYAIVGGDKTLMIDGGVTPALAREFTGALLRQTGRGVDYVALTHWHWDHVFGLPGVEAPVIACRNTAAHIERMGGYASWSDDALDARVRSGEEIEFCAQHIRRAYPGSQRDDILIRRPDIVFDGTLAFDLGGLACELVPLPPVHTDDSVAIHLPQHGLLFIGDSTGSNNYDRPAHYSAPAVLQLMDFIRGTGAQLIMESHALPATPEQFFTCNGILETAARAVLAGCADEAGLLGLLEKACASEPIDDLRELAALFISGARRQGVAL